MSLEAIAPLSDNSTVSLPAIAAWHGGPTRQGAALLHHSLGHDPVRNRRPHVQLAADQWFRTTPALKQRRLRASLAPAVSELCRAPSSFPRGAGSGPSPRSTRKGQ